MVNAENHRQRFPIGRGLALLSFLVAAALCLVIAARYQRNLDRQRQLYREYLAMNEWWFTIKPAYHSVQPLLDQVELVDPRKADLGPLNQLSSELEAKRRSLLEIRPPEFFPPHDRTRDLVPQINAVIRRYEAYLMDMRCLVAVRGDSAIPRLPDDPPSFDIFSKPASLVPNRTKSWQVITLVASAPHVRGVRDHPLSKLKVIYDVERKLSTEDVISAARANTLRYFQSMKADRAGLTRLMDRPAEVPRGLDLAFASKLQANSR